MAESMANLPPDVNKGPMELGIAITLTVLALIQVGLRLHTRIFVSRAMGWDDWLAAASMAFGVLQICFNGISVSWGYGRHIFYLTQEEALNALKYTVIAEPINIFAVGLQKVSIAVALLRLNLGASYRAIVWIAIIPNVIIVVFTLIIIFSRCRPIDLMWDISASGTCWPAEWNVATGYAQAASNILADIAFTVSPIVCLAKVQLTKYNQWALRVIFLVGLFATICSIVKITCLPALTVTTDPTWAGVPLSLWSTAELMIGLMVASAPALKPRYESFMQRFMNITHLTTDASRRRRGYGTANSNSLAYGGGRKTHGDPDHDDENDLKLDYYHKAIGGANHHAEIGQGFMHSPSSASSEDIIVLQGTSTEKLKTDQIRVTQTVVVEDSR